MLSHTEQLERRVLELEKQLTSQLFRLSNMIDEPQKVLFYTGFPDYATLRACYDYLGPAVNKLNYWGSVNSSDGKKNSGRTRSLPPLEEFFLVLVRLRLGLFERDLGDRFGISLSTVSRICITWINFLYIKLKEIPMWPKQESVHSCMPACFKELYPTTRVIIDATEIFIETPSLPELQQMTYSSYKNHNTYKECRLVVQLHLCQSFFLVLYLTKNLHERVDYWICYKAETPSWQTEALIFKTT